MAASQLALAMSAPWGDLKISGRKIKEVFYTQVDPPADTDSELPHFRCRCGKIRIQSLKHGYTNLKQHVLFKHPTWVLEHADEVQATPPASPKSERAAAATRTKASTKSKAAASPTPSTPNAKPNANASTIPPPVVATPPTSGSRKKRKASTAGAATSEATAEADVVEPPAKVPSTRRSRASSAASTSSSTSSAATAAPTPKATGDTLTSVVKKREDYISWDDYFMSVAFLSAMRSKDPSTQVGACIVNNERKIVGIGYNGFPNGCSDDTLPWARESKNDDPLETKYPFVCHAEMNAILNKNASDLKGCTIYIALFPCNECAKLIIQSGITHIVFLSDKYHDDWKMVASRRMLDMAGVQYRQHHVSKPTVVIDFSAIA